jgi:hypothetical protein
VPAIGRLPNSARSLLTVGPPVLWYLYSNVASARNNKKIRLHAEHSPETGSAVFTQGADMTQQRKDLKLSLPQRSAMWAVDNPLLAIGTLGAPLAGYGLYLNTQYPGMRFTQKVMKSSVAGQARHLLSSMLFERILCHARALTARAYTMYIRRALHVSIAR